MTGATQDAIRFEGVTRRFGGQIVFENLSFTVPAGQFLCLLGPSGCGKSTALRIMGDLLAADSGDIRIEGAPASEGWSRIAYVFQSPRLLPWKTALDNAAFGVEARNPSTPPSERRARALRELERVGLARDAEKMPFMLSGGERQRVAIARAMALDPHIILMDEPFSALDPNTRQRLRRQLVELWQGSGRTIVFVTHDVDEALYLADRILLLAPKPGRIARDLAVTAPRPRDVDGDDSLRALRAELHDAFAAMGEAVPEEERT